MSLEHLFDWLFATSWHVGLLALLVMLIQATAGRLLAPRWRYALWGVVVLRLCLPVVPRLDWNPVAREPELFGRPESEAALELEPAPLDVRMTRREAGVVEPEPEPVARPERRPREFERPAPQAVSPVGSAGPVTRALSWKALLAGTWLLGFAALVLRTILHERRFRRRIAQAAAVAPDDPRRALLERCAERVGVRAPELRETDAVLSPALCGWRRPSILLPARTVTTFGERELELVFLHELAHLRGRDVPLNVLLALLRACWWFHPFARLALTEFSRAQESVRDFQALDHASGGAHAYASTLFRWSQDPAPRLGSPRTAGFLHGHSFKRRIQMITRFGKFTPLSGALGLAAVSTVGVLGLTSAGTEVAPGPAESPAKLLQIDVERPVVPAWKQELLERLSRPIEVRVNDATLDELVDALRSKTQVNLIARREARENADDEGLQFSLDLQRTTGLQVLEAVRSIAPGYLDYSFTEDIVVLGETYLLPDALELRFYKLQPFHDQMELDSSELQDLVVEYGSRENASWDSEGVWIDTWNGVLVINQSARAHEEIEAFLNRMLNGGRAPEQPVPTWKRELETRLREKASIDVRDVTPLEALVGFAKDNGFPIRIDEDAEDALSEEELTLKLDGVSRERILAWILSGTHASMTLRNQGIFVGTSRELTLEFYDIRGIRDAMEESGGVDLDYVEHMLHNEVDPWSWDEDPAVSLVFWHDYLLVNQSPGAHREIEVLLGRLERALTP